MGLHVGIRLSDLWDEMIPVPTRKVSIRLTVTYAGFEGESELLEGLYKRGLAGEQIASSLYRQPGLLMAWHHEPIAPWQTRRGSRRCARSFAPTPTCA